MSTPAIWCRVVRFRDFQPCECYAVADSRGKRGAAAFPLLTECISKMVKIWHKMHHFWWKISKIFLEKGQSPLPRPPSRPLFPSSRSAAGATLSILAMSVPTISMVSRCQVSRFQSLHKGQGFYTTTIMITQKRDRKHNRTMSIICHISINLSNET